jgi:hypothetical protein
LFIAFTEAPDDAARRSNQLEALQDPATATHWVKAAAESWLSTDPPDEDVLLIRLETELLRLKAAVSLQLRRISAGDAGRVGELLFQNLDRSDVDVEQVEADLHFFLVAAAALFACARSVCDRLGLDQPDEPANLRAARNISQHIEKYNVGEGRNRSVLRQQVQTWRLRKERERAVWTWAGIEIDIEEVAVRALQLAGRLVDEIAARVPPEARGEYLLISSQPDDDVDRCD